MNSIVKKTFEIFPSLEVLFRHLYLKSKKKIQKVKKNNSVKQKEIYSDKNIQQFLRKYLKEGDIVIVHTRMSALKKFDLTPEKLIELIKQNVGEKGTIFMPVMPFYNEIASKKEFDVTVEEVIHYNKDYTKSWTGIVGNVFVDKFGALKSNVPYCTLAGLGPFVAEAFSEELESDKIFDKQSPWYKIMKNGGKVLFLGAEAYDSITESHLVEDSFDGFYVDKWHLKADFLINENIAKTFYIRKPFWNRYLTEFSNIKKMKKAKIIFTEFINNTEFSCVPSFEKLYSFYCECALKKTNPIFRIPNKYKK